VLEGELTLVTDAGEQLLTPGMCAAFKAGVPDGHHLVNRSDRPALLLEIGDRDPEDEAATPTSTCTTGRAGPTSASLPASRGDRTPGTAAEVRAFRVPPVPRPPAAGGTGGRRSPAGPGDWPYGWTGSP
jgi:uncharacterized cupin superfamily protein